MKKATRYHDYFDIDPKYFPCVDDSALRAGVDWTAFFPHETFVELLKETERVLSRQNKVSIWIEGAYGTGKSYAAWALKKILEASNDELNAYFARYPKNLSNDLLNKLLGHKAGGKIVVAHRYASSSIRGDRDLILAVQESVRNALEAAKVADKGSTTLKESVVKWIEKPANKGYFNTLLKSDDYRHIFHGKDADAVLTQLKNNGDVHDLMESIFKLSSNEGITALNMDMNQLVAWLEDVISRNNLEALVLVWDEFSEYFKNNAHSLTEFQKLVSVCQNKPFYMVIVTHESGSLFSDQNPDWRKLRDRFSRTEISLPENIAFDLIANALVKKEAAKLDWEKKTDDLNSRLVESRKVVATAAGVNETVLRAMLPLHPMAALLLKHIAKSFKSNQRSMFDFIKKSTENIDVKAFQWFISQYGPLDDQPLLTVDHLWNFFYERGRDDLAQDIRSVLDAYQRNESRLSAEEKRVLKTVLIMQAVGQKHGSAVEIFKTTDLNLALAFEGTDLESGIAVNIAKKLVRDEILFNKPLGGGKTMLAAVTAAGDTEQLEKDRDFVRNNIKTATLIQNGAMVDVLALTPAQKLRWELTAVSVDDFTRQINLLKDKGPAWKMRAVIGFAKDDAERDALRKLIKDASTKNDYKTLLFIDALAVPLGYDRFEEYVDYMANSKYYRGKDNHLAEDMDAKGRGVLTEWRNIIYNGQFVLYGALTPPGTLAANGPIALRELTNAALKKFPLGFDGFSGREVLFQPSQKKFAECGIKQMPLQFGMAGNGEAQSIIGAVAWQSEKSYWTEQPSLPISKIKSKVDERIQEQFKKDGRISVGTVFDFLMEEPFGFIPANVYVFLMGFLLKEYADTKYRWSDAHASDPMSAEKLADAIAEYAKHKDAPIRNYRDKFIVLMTEEERAFCRLTTKVFGIPENQCVSVEVSARLVSSKMKSFGYPLWVLDQMDSSNVYSVVESYMRLVNPQGQSQTDVALEIGKAALLDEALADKLTVLVTKDNCREGMKMFLSTFAHGKAMRLAKAIGADAELLEEVASKFDSSESLWLWDKATGEERIRDLILDYEIVERSNQINPQAKSVKECYSEWQSRLNFVRMSWDALKTEFPACAKLLDILRYVAQNGHLMAEKRQSFLEELCANELEVRSLFNESMRHFKSVYSSYLDGLGDSELDAVSAGLKNGLFICEKSEAYRCVNELVEEVKRNQAKTHLRKLWSEKTASRTPREWSQIHKTPILCMMPDSESTEARRTFDTLNRSNPEDAEIHAAEAWLNKAKWLVNLGDKTKCDDAFKIKVMGRYATMLPSVDEVRDLLSEKIVAEPYDWFPSPEVKARLEAEAGKRYNACGSDKVIEKIDSMDSVELKSWLKKLIKDNMTVGIEIIGG
jgi:hypothetical protein